MQADHQHLIISFNKRQHITLRRFHFYYFAIRFPHSHDIAIAAFPETPLAVTYKLVEKAVLTRCREIVFGISKLTFLHFK